MVKAEQEELGRSGSDNMGQMSWRESFDLR